MKYDFLPKKLTLENAKVLALNADCLPLSVNPLSLYTWQDAITMVFKGKATVIESYDSLELHSETLTIPVPSVIMLKDYVWVNPQVRFSRITLYKRDNWTCLYCGTKCESDSLNLDHVIPRSRGGESNFENLATSCIPCNMLKGDRLLDNSIYYPSGHIKAGERMKLLYKPYRPTYQQMARKEKVNFENVHPTWRDFLSYSYWNDELEQG